MRPEYSNKSQLTDPPIILLHGWGMNANIWQPTIQSLPIELQNRLVTLNLPGYHQEATLEQYKLEDLANWLNKYVTQPSIIIGWSLGGLIAQKFALQYPNKVIKLGLIGSTPKFMAADNWPGIKPDVLKLFATQLTKNHRLTIERFLAIQAMGSDTAKQDIKQLKELVLSTDEPDLHALSEGLKLLESEDLRLAWSNLHCPVSCLFGRLDSLVPNAAINQIAALCKYSEIEVIDKASHAPFVSHPQAFLKWFIKTVN